MAQRNLRRGAGGPAVGAVAGCGFGRRASMSESSRQGNEATSSVGGQDERPVEEIFLYLNSYR